LINVICTLADVQAVLFDAVGTLIEPMPTVASAYAGIGTKFGSTVTEAEMSQRFAVAFQRHSLKHKTSEEIEYEFWRQVVGEVLGPVHDEARCFEELYRHFAQPTSWRLINGVELLLNDIFSAGKTVAIASNFDGRLHAVMDGIPVLAQIKNRFISAEIGWRKPSEPFFLYCMNQLQCPPDQMLMVGDDCKNDVLAARAVGLNAIHISGNGTDPAAGTVKNIVELNQHWARG